MLASCELKTREHPDHYQEVLNHPSEIVREDFNKGERQGAIEDHRDRHWTI